MHNPNFHDLEKVNKLKYKIIAIESCDEAQPSSPSHIKFPMESYSSRSNNTQKTILLSIIRSILQKPDQ